MISGLVLCCQSCFLVFKYSCQYYLVHISVALLQQYITLNKKYSEQRTWILMGFILVIDHLKYCQTLCVADNSVLAKPEMSTSQLGAGDGGETHSIEILVFMYLLP